MRLKSMFLDKLSDKVGIIKNLSNIHISYKHSEKLFAISTKICTAHRNQRLAQSTNLTNDNVEIERNVLIKKIIDNYNEIITPENLTPKNVLVDFSSPNIAKPFHVGHLRSTIIGNFIANINKHFQNNVTKLNYLGDWGTQFGLLQYGLKAKNIDINEITSNPISSLYQIYVEANEMSQKDESVHDQARKYFTDIERGETSLEIWEKIRQVTVAELEKMYSRLGIKFDVYHWESDYNSKHIQGIIEMLEKRKIWFVDETGRKVVKVRDKNVTVLKSDGSTLYITRDIAALLDRYKKFNYDKHIYVVDKAQTDHFIALFDIVSKIDEKSVAGCEHIKFGRIKGMSTRKGNVIFLNDVLDEAKHKMCEKQLQAKNTRTSAMNEETWDVLGTTAVVINDLKQRRQNDYEFDWDKALQSEGDSGIKLQYLHCRLWSLENKCGVSPADTCEPDCLPEEIVGTVVAELVKFQSVLHRAYTENEACILVNYLFRLSRHVNRMFNELKVKDIDPYVGSQRLLVFKTAREVLKTSLEILGVKPLNEM
ncbi:probable arginine--tRNA ligase, mitochondrial [Aricia agestis]|uniref:probable arginine--tRNA ligase, mitochondrial n=1 Tax=Aricia agestis TaxID=91739 RepID=UPI001C202FBA|nr:probable arginine--tRNA ligase, mitochondrial [Aricia agestis]